MLVTNFREALLALDVIRDQVHRPGPVERAQRDDVVDRFKIELFAEAGHAAFQLEDADRFRAVEQRERRRIVERDLRERKIRKAFTNQFLRVVQDGERAEPKKIHLEKAEIVE